MHELHSTQGSEKRGAAEATPPVMKPRKQGILYVDFAGGIIFPRK